MLLDITFQRLAHVVDAIYCVLMTFIALGFVERLGYLWLKWRRAEAASATPPLQRVLERALGTGEGAGEGTGLWRGQIPTVCIQLPMFNESAVCKRAIDAACSLSWPRDLYEVQVLDDSTDASVRAMVDAVAAEWRGRGINCTVIRREQRSGYKAGALEAGRRQTSAEFLVLFDADFVPASDFLARTVPRFYSASGEAISELALVQAQWTHLNMAASPLTLAQSLWIDDHHVSQMNWRSEAWGFVNFTGTAGVWRASAIEAAGGWRAASLVEDCELSFRVLFCGYATRFATVRVPSELPESVTAYKAQQKRWTLGWAQLIRLHLGTLLIRHRCSPWKRIHLLYHMLLSVQWPMWMAWQLLTPWLIATKRSNGLSTYSALHDIAHTELHGGVNGLRGLEPSAFGGGDCSTGSIYLAPLAIHMLLASAIAAVERCGDEDVVAALALPSCVPIRPSLLPLPLQSQGRREMMDQAVLKAMRCLLLFLRLLPCALLSAGMLPHQACAWCEGIFSQSAEFECTPKNGSSHLVSTSTGDHPNGQARPSVQRARWRHWYVAVEVAFVGYEAVWLVYFCSQGWYDAAMGPALPILAVGGLCCCYGDTCRGWCNVGDAWARVVRGRDSSSKVRPGALHEGLLRL